MKSRFFHFASRLVLVVILTAIFIFGGLLVITPSSEEAGASWHKKYYGYDACSVCQDHDHETTYYDPRDM